MEGPLGEEPGLARLRPAPLPEGRSPLHAGLMLGLLVFDWRLWRAGSSAPRPAVSSLPLVGEA